MTKEQIYALIDAKIAGQGTAVDAGSVLPNILGGILEIIPDNAGDILEKLSVKTDLTVLQMIGASGTGLTKAATCQALGISVKDLDALMDGTAIRFEYGGGSLVVVSQTPERIVIGDVSAFSIVIGYDAAEGTYGVLASVNNVEFVKVTVNAYDETTVAGQVVTINDENYTVGESGIVIAQVPYGTNYNVSANAKDGYRTPATQSFTAGQPYRTVAMEYEEKIEGVFIHYTDGTVSPYDTLNPEKTPDGVSLVNDDVSFIMLPVEGTSKIWSDNKTTEISGVTTTNNMDAAMVDYAGETNTAAVIASGLAGNAFTFATENNGYLPSCGEMEQARLNETNINVAMNLIGGTALNFGRSYWASTQASASGAWEWNGTKWGSYSKNDNPAPACRVVRPL